MSGMELVCMIWKYPKEPNSPKVIVKGEMFERTATSLSRAEEKSLSGTNGYDLEVISTQ